MRRRKGRHLARSTLRESTRSSNLCAMSSNSSSASSSANWQPSHEANLKTASFGAGVVIMLRPTKRGLRGQCADRTVLADEFRPEHAMPAHAHGALHVSLQSAPDAAGRDAAGRRGADDVLHHYFRTACEDDRVSGPGQAQSRQRQRYRPYAPLPIGCGAIDRGFDIHAAVDPVRALRREEKVVGLRARRGA